jgi:hypothetical protein
MKELDEMGVVEDRHGKLSNYSSSLISIPLYFDFTAE